MRKVRKTASRTWRGVEALESRTMLAVFTASTPFTGVDPISGNSATFSMVGPGTGRLVHNSTDSAWDLSLKGTTRDTQVIITAAAGAVDLQSVVAATIVGSLSAPNVVFYAVAGNEGLSTMAFSGGILSLTMGDSNALTTGSHSISIGGADLTTDAVSLTFGKANDLAVDSKMPIASFTAKNLLAHTSSDPYIRSRAWIGDVTIAHSFLGVSSYPEIYADSANPATGFGVASVKIGGNMDSAEIYSDYGDIGPVTIGGSLDHDSEIYADYGSIGNVTIGENLDNGSEIYSDYGGIGNVSIGGNLDNDSYIEVGDQGDIGQVTIGGNMDHSSEIYTDDHGNIAGVSITGNMDNSAEIYTDERGDIGPVSVGGNMDHSAEIYTDEQGNISKVTVAGNVDNSAEIYTYHGNIGTVWIGGNLDNSAYVEADDYGDIGKVTVLGNVDNSAEIYVDYGDIRQVNIRGNLDNRAEVYASEGNIYNVRVAGNVDHSAEIYSDDGAYGIGNVWIGKNFNNGAEIYAYGAGIQSVMVHGGSTGTSSSRPYIYAYANIGSIWIAGRSVYGDFEAGRSIGSVTVYHLMRNGLVNCYNGGQIGSMTVGALDNTTVETGVHTPLAGTRADFVSQNSSIGSLVITGVTLRGTTFYMTNGSQVLAWNIGLLQCMGGSVGTGTIEYHTGNILGMATGVLDTQLA